MKVTGCFSRAAAVFAALAIVPGLAAMAANFTIYSFAGYSGPDVGTEARVPLTLIDGENGFSYSGFASATGGDLRVKDSGGNLLPHEIEKWDTSGLSLVWVKVPSLSSTTTLTLSWGDASAPTSSESVWSDALLVYHLGDCGPKESAQGIPSTQTVTNVVSAPSGQGTDFAGRTDASKRIVTLFSGSHRTKFANGQSINRFTISFWMKADDFTTTATYLSYLYRGGGEQLDVLYNFDSARAKKVTLYTVGAAGTDPASVSAIDVPDLGWHHYAYTYDGTTLCKYRDGVLTDAPAVSFSIPDSRPDWNTEFRVGGAGAASMFAGSLDEFRFEKSARSADEIAAEYALTAGECVLEFPEYDRSSTLENFPLMIALDRGLPGLSQYMRTAIYDREHLHFYAEDGTELFAEPEITPTNAAGNAVATYWVKMPSFASGSKVRVRPTTVANDMEISYASNNWDSAYYHVWHLATGRYLYDSASVNPLKLYGEYSSGTAAWTNFPAFVSGPSGAYGALQCGRNMLVYAETNGDPRSLTDRYTVSFWARKSRADFADPDRSGRYVFQMRRAIDSGRQLAVLTGFRDHDNDFYLWDSAGGDGPHVAIPDDGWHHYAFTCDGNATIGYRDGVQVASGAAFNFNLPNGMVEWYRLTMGGERYAMANGDQFIGDLDEFRIELEPRSADWIYASCRTQRGLVDGKPCSAKPVFGTESSVSATNQTSLLFSANLVCRIPSEVKFYYGQTFYDNVADAWSSNSVRLGVHECGRLEASVDSLASDQCVIGRFCASNAYGVAWSDILVGRAGTKPSGRYASIVVTNYTWGLPLENFPLCVKLPSWLRLPEEPTGLRFTDEAGVPLAFEVETWNPSGESVAWVRVPCLVNKMKICAVWGNPFAARGGAHPDTVWNDGFKAVWHMASARDSSPNARHFTTDTLSSDATGIVGGARAFDGRTGDANMKLDNDSLPSDILGEFTVSGWVKPDSDSKPSYLLQFFNGTYQFAVICGFDSARRLSLYSGGMINAYNSEAQNADLRDFASPIDLPDDGGWHHFAYSYGNGGFTAYLDGEAVRNAGRNYSFGCAYPKLQSWRLVVGQSGSKSYKYTGLLDEVARHVR